MRVLLLAEIGLGEAALSAFQHLSIAYPFRLQLALQRARAAVQATGNEFLIGFAGIVVLLGPDALVPLGGRIELAGQLACLGAAACYAVSSILMRRLPTVDPIGLSAVLLAIGAAAVIPAALLKEGLPPPIDTRTLLALAFLGLVPTAAANLLRVMVIRTAGPVFMSLTNYQVPVWAVLIGVVFLGEPLRASLLVATVLILIGVALSQWGALSRLFRARAKS